MNRLTAMICRRQGETYILAAQYTEVHVPVKKLKNFKLGDYIDFELVDGKWKIARGMKQVWERGDVVTAYGKVVDNEFQIQMKVDIAYDQYHRLWKGYSPELGNVLVIAPFSLKHKLREQPVWHADGLIRRLATAVDTPHMGKVKWALTEVNLSPKPDVEKDKKEVKKTTVEEIVSPTLKGEKVGLVVGMIEDYEGIVTAFVFVRRSDVAQDTILQIDNVGGVNNGDWIAFDCPDEMPADFEIYKFRIIDALISVKRVRNTVMLKLDKIDVDSTILSTKLFSHPDLGVISNKNEILQPGKDLTVVVEKKLPTEEDPHHWIVTSHLVYPKVIGDPKYANAMLVAYSTDVGPRAYHVCKEMLVCRIPYLAEKFSLYAPDGKYPVYGEPKAVGHVLEILINQDMPQASFIEHDAPLLEFWHGVHHVMKILRHWGIIYLAKFVVEKMILYHCEDRQCHHCVNRTAYTFIHGYPYPNRRNLNGATVAMWAKDYLDELKKAFPKKARRLQDFADHEF